MSLPFKYRNIEIFQKIEVESDGINETVDSSIGNFKAKIMQSKNQTRKINGSDNVQEIISDIIAGVKKVFETSYIRDIKHQGYFVVESQKYSIIDFLVSPIAGITYLYGKEINE